jgi:hypothetical protein
VAFGPATVTPERSSNPPRSREVVCELPDEDLRDLEAWREAVALEAARNAPSVRARHGPQFDATRIPAAREPVSAEY